MGTGPHLAVLIPGCGELRDGGIAVSSRIGPIVERLCELVGTTTLLAYDPPLVGAKQEDRVDFVMRPSNLSDVRFVSLGPKGTYRDMLARRKRVGAIVDELSGEWDLLFLPLTNRRVGTVFKRSKTRRIFSQIGGHTPTVIRDVPAPFHKTLLPRLGAALAERQYRRIAREALFFVNGEALLPYYAKPGTNVQVLRSSARRARHTYAVADRFQGDPQLLVVARITAPKGVYDALEAFALLRAGALPTATLHMVGNGDAEDGLRARAAELGLADAIVWHGWVAPGDDLYAIFRDMDVMLMPSLAESLPKTIWESMAHSVLVVSTPVGAIPHVFTDNEDLLFVPVHDPKAIAAAVERLASDPALRQRLIARGLETSALVTVDAIAEQLLDHVAARWPDLQAARD